MPQSTGRLWSPRVLRQTPIDPFQQISQLRRRDRHRPIRALARHGRWPDKPPAFEPLCEQAHALTIVPQHFYQRAAPAAEHEQMASVWIALERLLHQQRQPVEALAHVVASHTRAPAGSEIIAGPRRPRASRSSWSAWPGRLLRRSASAIHSRTPPRSGHEPASQSARALPQSALLQNSTPAATVEAAAVAIHTVGSRGSRPPAPPSKRWRSALAKQQPAAPSPQRSSAADVLPT